MASQELISYIVQQLKVSPDFADIKKSLLELGWDEKSVDEAYQEVLSVPVLPVSEEGEYIFEQFSPRTPRGRALKRAVILGMGVGLVAALFTVLQL